MTVNPTVMQLTALNSFLEAVFLNTYIENIVTRNVINVIKNIRFEFDISVI